MIGIFPYSEIRHLLARDKKTGYWQVCPEVMQWLEENDIIVREECFGLKDGTRRYGITFTNEIDHMAFKLRWA